MLCASRAARALMTAAPRSSPLKGPSASRLLTVPPLPPSPSRPPLPQQGLWHPARKVREVYWKIFNNLYIGAQDALVAFHPAMEDDEKNTYARHELDLVI